MAKEVSNKAEELLNTAGMYNTGPRVGVLNVLLKAREPLGRKDIGKLLGSAGPDAATIYRTLETFSQKGLVHKVYLAGRAVHYELSHNCGEIQCHPHFTCRRCGRTDCLLGVKMPIVKGLAQGYQVLRQQTRLEGICPSCTKAKGAEKGAGGKEGALPAQ